VAVEIFGVDPIGTKPGRPVLDRQAHQLQVTERQAQLRGSQFILAEGALRGIAFQKGGPEALLLAPGLFAQVQPIIADVVDADVEGTPAIAATVKVE
jgi:hypothetical protein